MKSSHYLIRLARTSFNRLFAYLIIIFLSTHFSLFISSSAIGSPITVVFREGINGYTGTSDSYVQGGSGGNSNFGSSPSLFMSTLESSYTYTYRTYIKFDVSSLVGTSIQNAVLKLYKTNGPNYNIVIKVYKVSNDWNENSITFNTAPKVVGVKDNEIIKTTVNSTANSISIDVTQLMRDALFDRTQPPKNINIAIEAYTRNRSWADSPLTFASSENLNSNLRPELTVNYDPSAPIAKIVQLPGTFDVGQSISIDGSISTGTGSLTYTWSFLKKSWYSQLSDAFFSNTAITSFVPDANGDYIIRLRVTDSTGSSSEDTVTIRVLHMEPHPRIFLGSGYRNELISRVNSNTPEWQLLKNVIDTVQSSEYGYKDYVASFAVAYATTGNVTYADKAINIMDTWYTFLDPSSLSAEDAQNAMPHFLIEFASAFDWLYDQLPTTKKANYVDYIKLGANFLRDQMDQYVEAQGPPGTAPTYDYYDNKWYTNASAVVMAGLAIYNDDPTTATVYLKTFTDYFDEEIIPVFDRMGLDGDNAEGQNYNSRFWRNFFKAVQAYKSATGEDLYNKSVNFEKIITNYIYSTHPNGLTMYPKGQLARDATASIFDYDREVVLLLVNKFKNSFGQWWLNNTYRNNMALKNQKIHDFLWVNPSIPQQPPTNLLLSYYSRGTGIVTMRSGWNFNQTSNDTFAHFMSGIHYSTTHQEFDANSFTIFKRDRISHDPSSWRNIYQNGSNFHNTLIINNNNQIVNYNEHNAGNISTYEDNGYYVYIVGEASSAYNSGNTINVNLFKREFIHLRPDYFIIMDRVVKPIAGIDTFLHHTVTEPSISGNEITAINGYGKIVLKTLYPGGTTITKENVIGSTGEIDAWRTRETAPSSNKIIFLHFLHATLSTNTVIPVEKIDANNMVGAYIRDPSKNYVVMFGSDPNGADITGTITYTIEPTTNSRHLLFNLPPSTSYNVDVNATQGSQTITVIPGSGSYTSSSQGVLTFDVSYSGSIIVNQPPSTPILIYPSNGDTSIPTTVTFKWNRSTDPDGDTVTYKLYYGTDQSFTGVTPIIVASVSKSNSLYSNAFGFLGTSLLFVFVAIGGFLKKKKIGLLIATLILAGLLLITCGGGDGTTDTSNEVTYTVSGLNTSTTYYWKVVADDGRGGQTSSYIWSFTTG